MARSSHATIPGMDSVKKKILIAEDEKPMARALELKLDHEGYDAKAVFNGEEALALLDQEEFHLIILDLMMPKVDGFTVLAKIKEKGKILPSIVLSNLSQEEDERKARELGATKFFVKSNTPLADIVQHVKEVLQ